MAAGGCARTILISRGWGRIRVRAAAPVSLAQYAIPATKTLRRACRPALMTTTMSRVTGMTRSPLPMGDQLITLGPPTEAASFRFTRRAQSSLDRVCGVVNRVLLRGRHACFSLTIVQMHSPSPSGWAGCLDDLILDTLVLHAGNNGPREQRFLSGFGLKSKTGHCDFQNRLLSVETGQLPPPR
jgi:hypothetical protein